MENWKWKIDDAARIGRRRSPGDVMREAGKFIAASKRRRPKKGGVSLLAHPQEPGLPAFFDGSKFMMITSHQGGLRVLQRAPAPLRPPWRGGTQPCIRRRTLSFRHRDASGLTPSPRVSPVDSEKAASPAAQAGRLVPPTAPPAQRVAVNASKLGASMAAL